MTRWRPDRVRMPFPHLTLVSRSSTCQRSPTMQPAPLRQVSIICSFDIQVYVKCLQTLAYFHVYIPGLMHLFCLLYGHFWAQNTEALCNFLWERNCVIITLSVIHPWVINPFSAAGASRSSSTTPKSSTPTSRPSSAKKIPVPSAPAKGEKELVAQVTQLTEQVCSWKFWWLHFKFHCYSETNNQ